MDLASFGDKPFTLAAARAAGVSAWTLRSQARCLFRGVHVAKRVEVTDLLLMRAALLLVPAGVVSHHSAAKLWGASAPDSDAVHLSVQRDRRATLPRISGIALHEMNSVERAVRHGLPVTPPERTFLDVARFSDLAALVVTGDDLVRRSAATPESLRSAARSGSGRGVRLAREAADYVRARVGSPMESRLRMLLVLAGLPEPVVCRTVYFEGGGWMAEPDLQYPMQKIAIEYDGRHHLDDPRQWRRDIARRENMEREGWLVRVFTAADVYRTPVTLVGRVLEDLHVRRHPGAPARVDFTHLSRSAA